MRNFFAKCKYLGIVVSLLSTMACSGNKQVTHHLKYFPKNSLSFFAAIDFDKVRSIDKPLMSNLFSMAGNLLGERFKKCDGELILKNIQQVTLFGDQENKRFTVVAHIPGYKESQLKQCFQQNAGTAYTEKKVGKSTVYLEKENEVFMPNGKDEIYVSNMDIAKYVLGAEKLKETAAEDLSGLVNQVQAKSKAPMLWGVMKDLNLAAPVMKAMKDIPMASAVSKMAQTPSPTNSALLFAVSADSGKPAQALLSVNTGFNIDNKVELIDNALEFKITLSEKVTALFLSTLHKFLPPQAITK